MFRERYYKRFPVRMKVIAYNAIIILCHPVKVAIFAIRNFFSLFGIAIFNIPISHNCFFCCFFCKVTAFFVIYKLFLTFLTFAV